MAEAESYDGPDSLSRFDRWYHHDPESDEAEGLYYNWNICAKVLDVWDTPEYLDNSCVDAKNVQIEGDDVPFENYHRLVEGVH